MSEELKRYRDDERPSTQCYDCGILYAEDHGFQDLVVSDDVWERINPTYHKGAGLLCPTCICRRLGIAGLSGVRATFRSGPIADNRTISQEQLEAAEHKFRQRYLGLQFDPVTEVPTYRELAVLIAETMGFEVE